jgi:exodeoxyribonuclease VII small subunit
MSTKPTNDPLPDQPTFEAGLKRLEEIVHLLEQGDVGLNEAMQRYEEGVKLLRQSYELLERAERRIELLSGVDAEGNPITKPFDDTATFTPGQIGQVPHNQDAVGQVGNLPNDHDEPGKRRGRRRSVANDLFDSGAIDP